MNIPDIQIGCVSNLYSRQMHFKKAGDIEIGHKHPFDHLTLLAKGSVSVKVDGVETTFIAPHMIFIQKDKIHEVKAMQDDTVVYCIHALRTGENVEDILDPAMIPAGKTAIETDLVKPLVSFD